MAVGGASRPVSTPSCFNAFLVSEWAGMGIADLARAMAPRPDRLREGLAVELPGGLLVFDAAGDRYLRSILRRPVAHVGSATSACDATVHF